ncbi:hypothetical protein DSO57_1028826 [Entomophthora muscae]|uniref:Uncharacterized protein n=1 Tax=Entomophthora muscae TaxID=34485 RepID=A0ACC2TND0_9FUNG|nr:hypothetical protein DSO57_1028826 [Entomophthora muscae]
MQISLLLASATSTALAAITCNVPDNKPSSIPLDCQVCLDSIIISNNSSTWPTTKLALQEIRGRLVVQAAIPEHLDIPLTVETLELNGKFPKGTKFKKIVTGVLEINKVESEGIIFDKMKPLVIKVDRSRVVIQGVSSSTISTLDIHGSTLERTVFHNLQKVGSLSMAASHVDIKYLLPSLREAHVINFSHMQSTCIELPHHENHWQHPILLQ